MTGPKLAACEREPELPASTSGERASKIDCSLVIGCYQEAEHLEESLVRVLHTLSVHRLRWELVFVDDASTDGTREILNRFIREHPDLPVNAYFHLLNQGRGRTVADGLRLARGRVCGFIDIDLEVSPVYIAACVEPILRGECDVSVGRRIYRVKILQLNRYLMSTVYRWLVARLLALKVRDTEAGYKFFDRDKILGPLSRCCDPGWFWDTEILWEADREGLVVQEVPCLFLRRSDKRSTVNTLEDSWDSFVKLLALRRR